jgi:hypothetical protein
LSVQLANHFNLFFQDRFILSDLLLQIGPELLGGLL